MHLDTRLKTAIRPGGLPCWGCAGSDEGREARTSLRTNDFVPMAIRKCCSRGCPHAIQFTHCLCASKPGGRTDPDPTRVWGFLGSYGANMAKGETTEVTHTPERKGGISHSARASCSAGGKQTITSRFKSSMTFTCQQISQRRRRNVFIRTLLVLRPNTQITNTYPSSPHPLSGMLLCLRRTLHACNNQQINSTLLAQHLSISFLPCASFQCTHRRAPAAASFHHPHCGLVSPLERWACVWEDP